MIRRKRKNDFSRTSGELESSLLRFDGTEESKEVGKHDAMSEFRSIVETIDFTTVLGESSERKDVVEIHSETLVLRIDVVDESFDILLRTLVERNDGQGRTLRSTLLVDSLVVLDTRGGNDELARKQGRAREGKKAYVDLE